MNGLLRFVYPGEGKNGIRGGSFPD
jgi:hypothetical protein